MATYLGRWETAKTKFTSATGEKKPKPKGFFNSFFNHTGLTTALKEADAVAALLEPGATKEADAPKAIAKAEEKFGKLSKAIASYLQILQKDAKMEQADSNAKTDLYRNLKVLSAELKAIDASAVQLLDSKKITMQKDLSVKEKAGKMIKTAPTPATFNELFAISDSPGRKIQVQLVSARNQLAAGKMNQLDVDPGYVAEKFTPWQGANSPNNNLPQDADKAAVIKRLEDFKNLLKLALHYSQQL